MVLIGRTSAGGTLEAPTWEKVRPGNQPAKVKKRITPTAVAQPGPANPLFGNVPPAEDPRMRHLAANEDIAERVVQGLVEADAARLGYGDIGPSKRRLKPVVWGAVDPKEEARKKAEAKLQKKQKDRWSAIIDKYEKIGNQDRLKSQDLRTPRTPREPRTPRTPRGKCDLAGYSKMRKATLMEMVGKALKGKSWRNYFPQGKYHDSLEEALKYSKVPELRALARKHCGYKHQGMKTTMTEEQVKKAASSVLQSLGLGIGGKIEKRRRERPLPDLPPPSPEEQLRQRAWRMVADIRQREAQLRRFNEEHHRREAERAAAAEVQSRARQRPALRLYLNEEHDQNADHNEVPRALRARAIRTLNNPVYQQFNDDPGVHEILEEIATTGRSPHDNDYIDAVLSVARRTIDEH